MLNIEKYENELRKYGVYFALTKEGSLVDCKDIHCVDCAFNIGCTIKRMNWLLEEYKEPILTEEEKEFIKTIISSFKERWLISIEWFETTITSRICIFAREKEGHDLIVESIEIPMLLLKESMFQGLEKNREYTLEELEL